MPKAREGAVLVNLPGSKNFYLLGGVINEPNNGMAKLLIKDEV